MTYKYITTESLDEGRIVRVMLNRPESRNAQNRGLLVELDEALLAAEADDNVRVIILGGVGPSFSAGHDMGSPEAREERTPGPNQHPTTLGYGGTAQALEKSMLQEWHFYLKNTLRWRDLRKVTIAQVQGKCYAGGLMLAWACDFIICSEDVEFADVVGARLGMCGLEYFAHPWEFGSRKAKELLMTGDSLGAEEAYRLGMVTKIFKNDELTEKTYEYAERIAKLPSVTSLLIKESVNQTQDNQGFHNAIQACFSMHQMNHAHWREITGGAGANPSMDWRTAPPLHAAEKYAP